MLILVALNHQQSWGRRVDCQAERRVDEKGWTGMRGDVLLYRSGGILKDRIVCVYTRGPFCHCEIDLGDGTTVGAHSEDGITRKPESLFDRKVVISLRARTAPDRIEAGIAEVLRHLGEPFSWASIADMVLPPTLSTLIFGRRSRYNCANLVAAYLAITGGLELIYGKRPPMIVSPNDIARAAGLLPAIEPVNRSAPAVTRNSRIILARDE